MMIDPILAHYIGGRIRRHTIRILKFKPGENLGHHFWVKFDGFAAIRMAMVSRPKYHALTQKWPMKAYYRANIEISTFLSVEKFDYHFRVKFYGESIGDGLKVQK